MPADDTSREHRHRQDDHAGRSHERHRNQSRSRSRERERDRDRRDHRERNGKSSKSQTDRHRSDRGDHDRERERRHRDHDSKGHRHETEEERRERKRAKRDDREGRDRDEKRDKRDRKDKRDKENGVKVVEDDASMWVEKGIDAEDAVSNIPTSDSLPLRSNPSTSTSAKLPHSTTTSSARHERDNWMLEPDSFEPPPAAAPTRDVPHSAKLDISDPSTPSRGDADFFSSFGTEYQRKDPNDAKPDPAKVGISRYELNSQLKEGKGIDEYATEGRKKVAPGGAGHQWRMMKLKRMQEQAQEQKRPVEEVALERYGSLEEYHEALEERRVLDERDARRSVRGGRDGISTPSTAGMRTPGGAEGSARKYMFSGGDDGDGYFSRPASRGGFRRPGEAADSTPGPAGAGSRISQLQRQESGYTAPPKVSTPIPSVFTPVISRGASTGAPRPEDAGTVSRAREDKPVLSIAELNKLQAAVLRAKLSDDENAAEMEDEYEYERLRYEGRASRVDDGRSGMYEGGHAGLQGQMGREDEYDERGNKVEVQVLPTLDGRGRLYDVGIGKDDGYGDHSTAPGGKKKRKKEPKFDTHDKEGNIVRYNADDDEQTLGELVRQERFGGGAGDQKVLDAEFAGAIARDARFSDGHDYLDENAERLARRKMKSDAMKRQFAINDFARTKKALDTCPFCYQEERNPLTAVVALGTRVYMCCTLTEELVPGHCLIVPIQHYMSSLEMDDEDWEEVKNFMKCLMRMYAKENKGVLFYETILSFRQQRHTYIEAVPVPFDQFQDCPAYFRESILASESEWSQHKKLIDFSARPGGFRRSLVSHVPYFAVMWDYKGEKGYGHVIEGEAENAGTAGNDEGEGGVYEGDKGGMGGFPPYFAGEVVGNILGLEPRKWLRPRPIDRSKNQERAKALGTNFQPFNWTLQLQAQ